MNESNPKALPKLTERRTYDPRTELVVSTDAVLAAMLELRHAANSAYVSDDDLCGRLENLRDAMAGWFPSYEMDEAELREALSPSTTEADASPEESR